MSATASSIANASPSLYPSIIAPVPEASTSWLISSIISNASLTIPDTGESSSRTTDFFVGSGDTIGLSCSTSASNPSAIFCLTSDTSGFSCASISSSVGTLTAESTNASLANFSLLSSTSFLSSKANSLLDCIRVSNSVKLWVWATAFFTACCW